MYKHFTILLSVLLVGMIFSYSFASALETATNLDDDFVDRQGSTQPNILWVVPAMGLGFCLLIEGCGTGGAPAPCTSGTLQCTNNVNTCERQLCRDGAWVTVSSAPSGTICTTVGTIPPDGTMCW